MNFRTEGENVRPAGMEYLNIPVSMKAMGSSLIRAGFDDVQGCLEGGMEAWETAGSPFGHLVEALGPRSGSKYVKNHYLRLSRRLHITRLARLGMPLLRVVRVAGLQLLQLIQRADHERGSTLHGSRILGNGSYRRKCLGRSILG